MEMLLALFPYIGSFIISFGDASFKTFQQRNISGGNERAAFVTSFPISGISIANVNFVLMAGWWILASASLGGACGVVAAMRLHKYLFKRNQNGEQTATDLGDSRT